MKHILITCHQLKNFAGSENMVLDFSTELRRQGYDVTVATLQFSEPIKSIFIQNCVRVVNICESDLEVKKYDYLICFHHIVLSYLIGKGISSKKTCFFSLGPSEPLEKPPSYYYLFNYGFFNSEECLEAHSRFFKDSFLESRTKVFLNSVSCDFINNNSTNELKEIKKICIVSNHPPKEVQLLAEVAKARGLDIDIIGRGKNSKHIHVTPKVLKNYDAVITIGRTVQYCLALGIPVFCYDRFGGPGYINLNNIDSSEKYNFSGRCCAEKYNVEELLNEITSNVLSASSEDFGKLVILAKKRYSLAKNLTELISYLDNSKERGFDHLDHNLLDSIYYSNLYVESKKRQFEAINALDRSGQKIENLEETVKALNERLTEFRFFQEQKTRTSSIDDDSQVNLRDMKLSVSFNFFNGEELLFSAVENIREQAEHISIVYQLVSNQGHKISDRALDVIKSLKDSGYVDDFIEFEPDLNSQAGLNEFRKRDVGLELAKINRCTHFLSMDADEFYLKEQFQQAKEIILKNDISCSVVPSYFYVKNPIWRSEGVDTTQVCFIVKIDEGLSFKYNQDFPANNIDSTRRFINMKNGFHIFDRSDICMHHMSYVRDDIDSKLLNSSNAKGNDVFMGKVREAFNEWTFGTDFCFPNQKPHKIIEVPDNFNLLKR
ncbi:TPA: hypothetical protein GRR52_08740 [Vibrio parahaemolyticus]|nr:hypothetical protein [Vibrio parahaemolyticus]